MPPPSCRSANGEDDLSHIDTMGFRGEALPSIGAVARLSIASRTADGEAHEINVDGGSVSGPAPAGFPRARPARHARRSARAVLCHAGAAEIPQIRALRRSGHHSTSSSGWRWRGPTSRFTLTLDGRARARSARRGRPVGRPAARAWRSIMGRDFGDNAAPVDAAREGVRLSGYAGLPTYNRANAQMQFLFVNGRPVRDKLLIGAVRGAYADFLARDRHPALALFLDCDPAFVDVNVHPAKTEVRFRDAGLVRGLIVGALKHALARGRPSRLHHRGGRGAGGVPARKRRSSIRQPQPYRPAQPCRAVREAAPLLVRRRAPVGAGGRGAGAADAPDTAARRRAGAVARDLCRGPDRGRHRHRRPACRA